MIPLFEYEGKPWTVLGFPMSQNRLSVPTWSYAMEQYPPRTIIELGSYNGGFATAIGVHAWRINAEVHSFEKAQCPDEHWKSLSAFLGIRFHLGDLFSPKLSAVIVGLIQQEERCYLLCDNGNKVEEFKKFAPFLKSGDVIGAHDHCAPGHEWWPWREIAPEQVKESVEANGLEPWMQEHFDMAGWLVYKKK